MIDTNILIGLLSGSLATLVAKEIINQINKHQDFTRDLKKITYIKKLEKAENAIAFYWTYLNKVTEMKKSLEFVIKAVNEIEENDRDIQIIQEILNKNGQAITDLSGEKYSNINAIHLYFDLEDTEKWNENDIEKLLQSLSETKSIDNEIKFWTDLSDTSKKANDTAQADIYWTKAIELLPTHVASLQNFIDCLERNKNASYGIVQSIKKQLKRY
jgi:tetratricopeptide (TPR) repeat protein